MNLIALLWGFAEATFFFIVPDVWLSALALFSFRRALRASGYALGGALLGGNLMYLWGRSAPETAAGFVESIPAISAALMSRANTELAQQGVSAVLFGILSGTPYKVFAVHAATAGIAWPDFLLISIPARGLRFLLSTLIAQGAAATVLRSVAGSVRLWVWASFWVVFYSAYFSLMAS